MRRPGVRYCISSVNTFSVSLVYRFSRVRSTAPVHLLHPMVVTESFLCRRLLLSLRYCSVNCSFAAVFTTTEQAISGAWFYNSVAHLWVCLVCHRILAANFFSMAHRGHAPQKCHLSVAHHGQCATEIGRHDPYEESFCGALHMVRHRKWCATKNKKSAPQKY